MYKIGLSTVAKPVCEELFRNYAAAGISAMEFSLKAQIYETFDFKKAEEWAKKYNVDLWSCHLPYRTSEKINLVEKSMQKQTVSYLSEIIKRAADGGVGKYIMHGSFSGITDENREESMKCSKENLAQLSDIAKQSGGTLVVENLPPACLGRTSDEILEMISVSDDLRVCVDTNHFLLDETPADYIHKLGDKLVSVHISDYDMVNERHWLPGEGKNDWQSILKALKDVNYGGVWLYEVAFIPVDTIQRERDLTCEDFVKNANEIFGNEKVTVYGKPAKGLY